MKQTFVSYVRVSTKAQGASGLGLEAQGAAVRAYVDQAGGEIVGNFVEIESGAKDDRPALLQALACCRRTKSTLLIAKLDRLGRSVRFVSTVMDSGVDFRAVDNPHATRLTLHILAAVAEHEREAIAARTRAALAAAKSRGIRLGAPDPKIGADRSRAVRTSKAKQRAENLAPIISRIRATGISSLREIAAALNARGVKSPSGGQWYAASVARAEQRGAS